MTCDGLLAPYSNLSNVRTEEVNHFINGTLRVTGPVDNTLQVPHFRGHVRRKCFQLHICALEPVLQARNGAWKSDAKLMVSPSALLSACARLSPSFNCVSTSESVCRRAIKLRAADRQATVWLHPDCGAAGAGEGKEILVVRSVRFDAEEVTFTVGAARSGHAIEHCTVKC